MKEMNEFAKRRKQLLQKIGPKGVVILIAPATAIRNNDCEFPYRQASDLYYLTGFEEPYAAAVFLPKRKSGEFILFNRPNNRDEEVWDGKRIGQAGARSRFGADEAYPIQDLGKKLPELLEGREEIHYSLGVDKQFDQLLLSVINKMRNKIRSGMQSPPVFVDITPSIHEMRLIKSSYEISLMQKAATISSDAHIRAMRECRPGMNEHQVEAEYLYECHRQGARFQAYNAIVGAGENTCVLHYTANNKKIKDGDLVLIDAGCEYEYYASDITRTFPANGKFSAEQRAIYEIVLEAQMAGIKAIKPGASFSAYQDITVKILTQGLKDVGILKGSLQTLIENKAYLPFYMHKAGHWLGLDVHDVGRYKVNDKWRTLEPGMVLTVEPGLYLSAETQGLAKRWHNIGIRIEDDVVVTKKGCEVLSAKTPKQIDELEAIVGKK